ncbi:DNA polymerase [Desulfofundulus thermobenzoicus]|nr:DNA polymerase [Desulfofundulus thermobenzoicus]
MPGLLVAFPFFPSLVNDSLPLEEMFAAAVDVVRRETSAAAARWAKEAAPELWAAIGEAEKAVDAAYRKNDRQAVIEACREYILAWRAIARAHAAAAAGAGEDGVNETSETEPIEDFSPADPHGVFVGFDECANLRGISFESFKKDADNLGNKNLLNIGAPGQGKEVYVKQLGNEDPASGKASAPVVAGTRAEARFDANGQMTLFATPKPEPPARMEQADLSGWQAWLDRTEIIRVAGLEAWRSVLAGARRAGICGLDTETTGLDPLQDEIRLVQLALPVYPETGRLTARDGKGPEPGGKVKSHVLDMFSLPEAERREVLEDLAGLLADGSVVKIFHNAKFDLAFIRAGLGRRIEVNRIFDTMLASQLAWAGFYRLEVSEKATKNRLKEVYPHHRLADLAKRHLDLDLDKTEQAGDWSAKVLFQKQIQYAGLDAAVLLPVYEIVNELISRNGLEKAAELEFSSLPAIVELELNGMLFDAAAAREMLAKISAERDDLKKRLVEMAENAGFRAIPKKSMKNYSPDLNPSSQDDVLRCLAKMGYVVSDTRDETLQDLEKAGCEFAAGILRYRERAKKAKFLEEWLDKQSSDGRIRASYWQLNPHAVGRLSSSSPNLQQCPRGKEFRRLFVAPAGCKLVLADYSGIELRIMAWLSGDKTMIQAFCDGKDLHRLTAAATSGKDPENVSKEERQAAKAVNFGLIYGCGPGRLQQSAKYDYGVEMSELEARRAREAFFRKYPGIAEWHQKQKALMSKPEPHWFHHIKQGFFTLRLVSVRTASGRKRVWPNYEKRTQARFTMLANTPDQGTGADMIKRALARVYAGLLERGWEDVKIVESVHDELGLECPENMAGEIRDFLVAEMAAAGEEFISPVPVEVEAGIGNSWAEK